MPDSRGSAKRHGFVSIIIRCAGPGRLWLGASSVVSGTACAIYTGNFSLWPAVLCLIATLTTQTGFNMLRNGLRIRYAAEKDDEQSNRLQEVPMGEVLKEGAKCCFLIAGLAFAGLVFMSGLWALVPVALVGMIGYLYLGTTSPLFGSWWEGLCRFFYFGPIAVFCTFFYQALHNWGSFGLVMTDAGPALLTSLLIGMLAVNASLVGDCYVNDYFPMLHKQNFATTFGTKGVSWLILCTGVIFYAIQWIQHVKYPIPHGDLVITALSISFVLNIVVALGIRKNIRKRVENMYRLALLNPFIYSVLAMIVLIILREPDHGGYIVFD